MTAIVLNIPVPPSVNAMYANVPGKGRVKTKAYKDWLDVAGWEIVGQRAGRRIGGVVNITIEMRRTNMRRDVDGPIKACLDVLVKMGITDDDCRVNKVSAEWSNSVERCRVTIRKHEINILEAE